MSEETTPKELRDRAWSDIRDLLNFHRKSAGPLSQSIKDRLDEICEEDEELAAMSDDEMRQRTDLLRAELIAARCAAIACLVEDGPVHGQPLSMILGAWAGNAHQAEIRELLENNPLFGIFFGALFQDE